MNFIQSKFAVLRNRLVALFSSAPSHTNSKLRQTNQQSKRFFSTNSTALTTSAEYARKFFTWNGSKIIRNVLMVGVLSAFYHKQIVSCIEDEMIQKAKKQIEAQIASMKREFGTQMATFPEIKFSTRGSKYMIDFTVDQRKCDLYQLLITVLDTFERKKEESHFKVKNVSAIREGDILNIQIDFEEGMGTHKGRLACKGTIYMSGEMIADRAGFKFIIEKTDEISNLDIQALMSVYRAANQPQQYSFIKDRVKQATSSTSQTDATQKSKAQKSAKDVKKEKDDAITKLEELGVSVFMPEIKSANLDWDYLAGYETQKRDIEDTVLLALQYPEIYDQITSGTRMKPEPNRPKAVLFEGPPGTGKTTSAKIIAQQVNIPLIYMPLESIMSKYYGEAEKKFADLWEAAKLLGKSIIFIDEIDAIAGTRDSEMHEASRRILSTLLRKIDSFESTSDVLLVCATNRKQDLDAAMLSRIDMSIKFEKPDSLSRQAIFKRYAKHLPEEQLKQLADSSDELSGRNISDICKDAERRWASKMIRKEVEGNLPSIDQYIQALNNRKFQNLA